MTDVARGKVLMNRKAEHVLTEKPRVIAFARFASLPRRSAIGAKAGSIVPELQRINAAFFQQRGGAGLVVDQNRIKQRADSIGQIAMQRVDPAVELRSELTVVGNA